MEEGGWGDGLPAGGCCDLAPPPHRREASAEGGGGGGAPAVWRLGRRCALRKREGAGLWDGKDGVGAWRWRRDGCCPCGCTPTPPSTPARSLWTRCTCGGYGLGAPPRRVGAAPRCGGASSGWGRRPLAIGALAAARAAAAAARVGTHGGVGGGGGGRWRVHRRRGCSAGPPARAVVAATARAPRASVDPRPRGHSVHRY